MANETVLAQVITIMNSTVINGKYEVKAIVISSKLTTATATATATETEFDH